MSLMKVNIRKKRAYGYWQALYRSFFCQNLYTDVGTHWGGFGFIYLFFLISVFVFPFTLRSAIGLNQYFNEKMIQPIENLPLLTIHDGKISLDKPMPYLIKNDQGKVITAIDTTGHTKVTDYPDLLMLITKNKLFYYYLKPQLFFMKDNPQNKKVFYEQALDARINGVFNGSQWGKSFKVRCLKYLMEACLYPLLICIFSSLYISIFLAFSLMGQFLSSVFFNYSISFKQSCRLLSISTTPPLLLFVGVLTSGYSFGGLNVVILVLLIWYYCFGIWALKQNSKRWIQT